MPPDRGEGWSLRRAYVWRHHAAHRDGTTIFCDLIGKLGMLRIECAKCGRTGKYRLAVLIAKYGRDEKLFTWTDELTADCPRKLAGNANDPCGVRCPDLPKVL